MLDQEGIANTFFRPTTHDATIYPLFVRREHFCPVLFTFFFKELYTIIFEFEHSHERSFKKVLKRFKILYLEHRIKNKDTVGVKTFLKICIS